MGRTGELLVVLVLLDLAACGALPADEADGPDADPVTTLRGSLTTRTRSRFTDGEQDHDLFGVLALDGGDATRDRVTWSTQAQLLVDLDGAPDDENEFVFFSLADTYDTAVTARLFHAYLDVHRVEGFSELRVGRQADWRAPEYAYFDGVSAASEEVGALAWRFGAYGGVPVHRFESSSSGDVLGGVWTETRPWEGGRLRLDWMHLEDEVLNTSRTNDLWALGWWQQLGPSTLLDARHSRLGSDPRDLRGHVLFSTGEADLQLDLTYYELFRTQGELAIPADPFSSVLFEYFPFRQGGALLTKYVGESLALRGGYDVRRLADSGDEGTFNHEFDRARIGAWFGELLPKDVELDLDLESWRSTGSRTESVAFGLTKAFESSLRLRLGSAFALYKYDLLTDTERTDVQTTFLDLRYDLAADTTARLRYEYEDSDLGDFHDLRLGVTWSF